MCFQIQLLLSFNCVGVTQLGAVLLRLKWNFLHPQIQPLILLFRIFDYKAIPVRQPSGAAIAPTTLTNVCSLGQQAVDEAQSNAGDVAKISACAIGL